MDKWTKQSWEHRVIELVFSDLLLSLHLLQQLLRFIEPSRISLVGKSLPTVKRSGRKTQ